MFDWLTSTVRPPGISAKGRRGIFKAVGAVGTVVANDAAAVLRAWFPLTASAKDLTTHGTVLSIPMFQGDKGDDYRLRTAGAAAYLERLGRRSFVREYLDGFIPDRYQLQELPKMGFRIGASRIGVDPIGNGNRLFVQVRGLTSEEKTAIYEALDRSLDPDIEIVIVPWIVGVPENLTMAQVRLYGGSRWLSTMFKDIGARIDTRVLPDDAFRIGRTRIGYAVIWGSIAGDRVHIHCPGSCRAAVTRRAKSMFADSVRWEVMEAMSG